MKSTLKRTLYVGLAAVSVLAAASFTAAIASAKSAAYVTKTSYFTTPPASRNVAPNGKNALYTKVGTSKGARVVVPKTTMKNLSLSKKSADYFRAYAIVTTNRGSVYYKVVSFNGKYRGWVYGGKIVGRFSGGIQAVNTTEKAATPTATSGYTLTNPSKWTLWNSPQYTQYKASKVKGFSNNDTFTITGAVTKSREGWVYYQVKDEQNSSITGWVYNLGVQTPQNSAIKIIYIDKATGQQVGTGSVPANQSIPTTNLTDGASLISVRNGVPSGYVPYASGSEPFVDYNAARTAKKGDTLAFDVASIASHTTTSMVSITPYTMDNVPINLTAHDRAVLDTEGRSDANQMTKGLSYSSNALSDIIISIGLNNLTDQNGHQYKLDHCVLVDGSYTKDGVVDAKAYYTAR
ncbi:GW dipeptide domain-containing protein [Secundilactobacillus yichangensis]|uniref:GW dipeptide domain-containing protein n=1 Tax=Secundilactobacillus yichangensis TaxID=2799580 RepID=UPI0019432A00|nr:GW dipeptide domain-containing protein [Secundilactobacillus yichangensis]